MARLIDFLKQNKELAQKFGQKLIEQKSHSTFLVVGSDVEQKYKFIYASMQFLFCDKVNLQANIKHAFDAKVPCGLCPGCLKVEGQKSENFLKIVPEKNSIKVEDSHQVVQYFNLQKWGKARVVIIEDAQLMTAQAANILLKTLEEPPENSYFFLMVPSAASVLPTIKSRSQILFIKSEAKVDFIYSEEDQKCARILLSLKEKSFDLLEPELKIYFSDKESALSTVQVWLAECRKQMTQDHAAVVLIDAGSNQASLQEAWSDIAGLCIKLEQSILQNRDLGLVFDEFFIESKRILGSA